MAHDGPWTNDQDIFIVAYKLGTAWKWDEIKDEFCRRFTWQGEPVKTTTKDISSRFNKTLKRQPRCQAFQDYLDIKNYDREHIAFVNTCNELFDVSAEEDEEEEEKEEEVEEEEDDDDDDDKKEKDNNKKYVTGLERKSCGDPANRPIGNSP